MSEAEHARALHAAQQEQARQQVPQPVQPAHPAQGYHLPQAPAHPHGAPQAPEYTHPPDYTQPPQAPQYTQPPQRHETVQYTHPPRQQPAVPAEVAAADYAPQFDRYAPPPPEQQYQEHYAAEHAAHDPAYEQTAPGQINPEHYADPGAAQAPDPRGYDLGHYNPAAPVAPGVAQELSHQADHAYQADPYGAAAGYQPDGHQQSSLGGYPAQYHPPQDPQLLQGHDPQMQQDWPGQDGQQQHYADAGAGGYAPALEFDGQTDDFADVDDGYDEPRNGGRGLLIASSLVGAIALGGGLAYAYKHFAGGSKTASGPARVIAADSRPVKMRPKNPGGKSFRNQDRKVFSDRLGSGSSRPATRLSDNGTVRKVPTMVINRNGNVAPPAVRPAPRVAAAVAQPTTPAAPANRLAVPGVYVPGLTIAAPRTAVPRQPIAQPTRQPLVVPPRVAQLPKARPLAQQPVAVRPALRPAARAPKVIAKAIAPKRAAAAFPVVAATGSGSSGYVAWISSSKDKMRSLASFASLQQKYPAILAGKQPEIQQKEVPNRGTWYRLRIGPPASKEATKALCNSLVQGKGVKQCFVRRF